MIAVSAALPGALYQQVVDGIKREISDGRLKPETQLPSFRVLAEALMVSLITVKRAYAELEKEGIIYGKQGIGTFVSSHGVEVNRAARLRKAERLMAEAALEALQAGMSGSEFIEMAARVAQAAEE